MALVFYTSLCDGIANAIDLSIPKPEECPECNVFMGDICDGCPLGMSKGTPQLGAIINGMQWKGAAWSPNIDPDFHDSEAWISIRL